MTTQWWYNLFVYSIIVLSVLYTIAVACPNECSCKWKSGKQTVECLDRGLITVPSGIEPDTQVLDLSGNDLQELRRDTFQKSPLISLQKLYLRSCRLGQIDRNAFRGLQNVVEIDLSANLLTHVPSQAFDDVPFLRNISLAHNPIQKVEAFAFRVVNQLSKLDLSQCHIQSIQAKAFDGLDTLDYLKLNDNQLQDMPTDTLQSLRRLHVVELQGNPWKCDCQLRSLKEWTSGTDNHVPQPIFCTGGPERLKDKSIMELDEDDFACRPSIKANVRRIETALGCNVTLECRVESDPIATISWYFGSGHMLSNDSIYDNGQRLYIVETEEGLHEKRSRLTLKMVEESDAGDYHCVAENRAGNDEANFTLLPIAAAAGPLVSLGSSSVNVITIALACLIAFMLLVIILLIRRIRYASYSDDDDDEKYPKKTTKVDKNSMETSSQKSHDSEIKSDSGKAFTVTSDLSYSRSLSDIGNPATFSNPDLISGTNVRDSGCITPLPITRPISDYYNWQRSYPIPRAASSSGFNYEAAAMAAAMHDRMILETTSAGSAGSDEVFAHSRMSNDYPPDYGLPILPEDGIVSQPCAKTLKVWQRGVPVLPPLCAGGPPPPPFHPAAPPPPMPSSYLPPHPGQSSPADRRYQRCGTDV